MQDLQVVLLKNLRVQRDRNRKFSYSSDPEWFLQQVTLTELLRHKTQTLELSVPPALQTEAHKPVQQFV